MHPFIEPSDNYEPSPDSKSKWLATKKSKITFSDLKLPGLYQTSRYKTHRILVLGVIVIELYGLYILYNVLPQPLLALLFTGLDFILAILAHLYVSKLNLAKNIVVLAKNGYSFTSNITPEGEKRIQRQKILRYHLYEWVFRSLIIVVALIKIVETLHYGSYIVGGQLIFICVLYSLAAIIHIFITGNFLSELWFRYGFIWGGIKKERRDTLENAIPTAQRVQFYREIDLGNKYLQVTAGKQQIIDSTDGASSVVRIWGILQDEELDTLATQQGTKSKELAIKLLRIQLKNIEQSALINEQNSPSTFEEFIQTKSR